MFWPWCSQKWTWILVIFPWKFRIHIHTIISEVQSNFLHFNCAPERSSLYSEKDVFWLPSSLRLIDKFCLISFKIYFDVLTILPITNKEMPCLKFIFFVVILYKNLSICIQMLTDKKAIFWHLRVLMHWHGKTKLHLNLALLWYL